MDVVTDGSRNGAANRPILQPTGEREPHFPKRSARFPLASGHNNLAGNRWEIKSLQRLYHNATQPERNTGKRAVPVVTIPEKRTPFLLLPPPSVVTPAPAVAQRFSCAFSFDASPVGENGSGANDADPLPPVCASSLPACAGSRHAAGEGAGCPPRPGTRSSRPAVRLARLAAPDGPRRLD
ncbi:hypothetical protein SKAU_G00318260 [Synaphobranchus kaupii]|uniref:Uncharacterized protein n=1 Tax=Synaphobranchus kaupii TaxID=118154 RepID=A0A9Q1ET49_SYNKA|nr:hypothetical protein SKAU_G00318260 [Synaphobranchus kaupii]